MSGAVPDRVDQRINVNRDVLVRIGVHVTLLLRGCDECQCGLREAGDVPVVIVATCVVPNTGVQVRTDAYVK